MGIWSWNDIPIYNMGITFPYVILESHSHISYGNIISICIMQNVFYYFSYYFVTQPLLFKSVQNSWPCLKLNLPRRHFVAPVAPRACNATRPVRVHRSLRSHLLYWNTTRDQSEGLFRGLTSNPKYTASPLHKCAKLMAMSEVEPPQAPLRNET